MPSSWVCSSAESKGWEIGPPAEAVAHSRPQLGQEGDWVGRKAVRCARGCPGQTCTVTPAASGVALRSLGAPADSLTLARRCVESPPGPVCALSCQARVCGLAPGRDFASLSLPAFSWESWLRPPTGE